MAFIKAYDSLSKKIIDLDQISKEKPVTWYSCGPTVYDMAHLGHARNFMTFDIIKRILNYMGYSINYVMNITDIDDKIIDRVNIINKSMTYLMNNVVYDTTISNYLNNFSTNNEEFYFELLINDSIFRDIVIAYINKIDYKDNKYNLFDKFIKYIENDFWDDLDSLNIIRPTVITRVTENIDKIINYISKIIENGYAYEQDGSVYFDSEKFRESGKQFRPLCPNIKDADNLVNETDFIKKSPNDFALWKKTKDNEISYNSIFGPGRPGWHIECSVMASDILSNTFDIHSGGIDLMFPHHNNEIIQAQAYQNISCDFTWAKYFLHSGQLTVDGKKMAKSLNNYITIKDFIKNNSDPNILRLLFLLHEWDKPFDYSQDKLNEVNNYLKKIFDFIKHINYEFKKSKNKSVINEIDNIYYNNVINYKNFVIDKMCDNFNTPAIIKIIYDMINKSYSYLKLDYNYIYINEFTKHMIHILEILGLNMNIEPIIFNKLNEEKWIDLIVNFRLELRNYLKNKDKSFGQIFSMLDDLRDNKIKNLGVKLEDNSGNNMKWVYL